jgi:hypothetical protein
MQVDDGLPVSDAALYIVGRMSDDPFEVRRHQGRCNDLRHCRRSGLQALVER